MTTTTHIHYESCDYCRGTGERPGGASYLAGAQACAWGVCIFCNGEGMVPVDYGCPACCDTGIDLEAPVNLASPPPCPCCQPATRAA